MSTHDGLRSWLTDAADSAIELAARHEISEGAHIFRTAIETAAAIPYEPQMLPVLRNLSRVANSERALKFAELAPFLRWIPSHRWDDEGQDRALCVLSDVFDMPGI